jgi:hypothetical protein
MKAPYTQRYRFDRKLNVVADTRRLMPNVGTDEYRSGDLIFRPRHCSPARALFREIHHANRAAKRAAA